MAVVYNTNNYDNHSNWSRVYYYVQQLGYVQVWGFGFLGFQVHSSVKENDSDDNPIFLPWATSRTTQQNSFTLMDNHMAIDMDIGVVHRI